CAYEVPAFCLIIAYVAGRHTTLGGAKLHWQEVLFAHLVEVAHVRTLASTRLSFLHPHQVLARTVNELVITLIGEQHFWSCGQVLTHANHRKRVSTIEVLVVDDEMGTTSLC